MFAELCCFSNFTFLTGASHPEEIVCKAAHLGYRGVGLTDEATVSGSVRSHISAKSEDILLFHGAYFRLLDGICLTCLVPNLEAWQELCRLISLGRRRAKKGTYQLNLSDLIGASENLLCLWHPNFEQKNWKKVLKSLCGIFKNRLWIAANLPQNGNQFGQIEQISLASFEFNLPVVATSRPLMHIRKRLKLQHTLTAIRRNSCLNNIIDQLEPSSERCLLSINELKNRYPQKWLSESLNILSHLNFSLCELKYNYPSELVPPTYLSDQDYLKALVINGAKKRWHNCIPKNMKSLIEKELSLIKELKYARYFLTVQDIVAFAREHNILCQGRGSAANSVVCYCLFITEIDPNRISVLFERFISRERNEPPDIDIDFEHQRRDEVIDYIYKKYSRERSALASAVITYRKKSAIRDVGKALGMSPELISTLSGSISWWDHHDLLSNRLSEIGINPETPLVRSVIDITKQIIGFPRHLTQHTGGFIISDQPLSNLCPLENTAMVERTCLQWDKNDLDTLGFLKIDILSLGILSSIRGALESANYYSKLKAPGTKYWKNPPKSPADIPPEDPAVYKMLSSGDAIGVFQVESRAQLSMLPRLKPKTYYDLVIEVAIVRPGPIQGEMVHPYLRRRNGQEDCERHPPDLKKILDRTLGIPIFQEQVIKTVMVAAGFSGGEADALRRAMSRWKSHGNLDQFREPILNGMLRRGYDKKFSEKLIKQIEGFGEYGFPESHAASFALLVYISAWLKCHLPAAFYLGLLNAQPMGFYTPSQLINDAKKHNIEIRPIDVNMSFNTCTLEPGKKNPTIRLGLSMIKGLTQKTINQILKVRSVSVFINLADFQNRIKASLNELRKLSSAEAFNSFSKNIYESNWQLNDLESQLPLFKNQTSRSEYKPPEPSKGEVMIANFSSTGLSLKSHPMEILRNKSIFKYCKKSNELCSYKSTEKSILWVAGLVANKQRPGSASGTIFLTLEDEEGQINIIVWPKLVEVFRQQILNGKLLKIRGHIQNSENVIHIIAKNIVDASDVLGKISVPYRIFH